MKAGITTTIALTLLAGAATAGAQAQGRRPRPQQRPEACQQQQQRQGCPACGAQRRGGRKQCQQFNAGHHRQEFQGCRGKSPRQQLSPQQRQMIRMKKLQKLQRQQFQGRPQQQQPFQGHPQQRQFQGQPQPFQGHPQPQQFQGQPQPFPGHPQPQQFQGEPRPRPFPGQQGQLPPNITPEQRKHIQKMQQRFKQDVRRYLSGQEKTGHGKPQGNHPPKKQGKPHKQPRLPDAE